jgi:hypothetical protein
MDREPALRPTLTPPSASPAVQAIHGVWKEIQAHEQRMLEELTLAELVRRTQPSGAFSYQI